MNDLTPPDAATGVTIGTIIAAAAAALWRFLHMRTKALGDPGDPAVLPSIAVYPIEYGRRLQDYKNAFDAHVLLMLKFREDFEEHVRTVEPVQRDFILRGARIDALEAGAERDRLNGARDRTNGAHNLEKSEGRVERRLDIIEQELRARRGA